LNDVKAIQNLLIQKLQPESINDNTLNLITGSLSRSLFKSTADPWKQRLTDFQLLLSKFQFPTASLIGTYTRRQGVNKAPEMLQKILYIEPCYSFIGRSQLKVFLGAR
jgi:hypothetical protein